MRVRQQAPLAPAPAGPRLLNGSVELLNLVPQLLGLLLQGRPLLLQHGDVLSCLLQGRGFADLWALPVGAQVLGPTETLGDRKRQLAI